MNGLIAPSKGASKDDNNNNQNRNGGVIPPQQNKLCYDDDNIVKKRNFGGISLPQNDIDYVYDAEQASGIKNVIGNNVYITPSCVVLMDGDNNNNKRLYDGHMTPSESV